MSRCTSCSAPLPVESNRCAYCGTRNDVDFMNGIKYSVDQPVSARICPHCDLPLQTINLSTDTIFLIERCNQCFGLFFDPGEIEALLDSTVSKVFTIKKQQLASLNQERTQDLKEIRYIKCPVCRQMMNRVNFGHRSGVIMDQCSSHGIWLDSGEITRLLEWKKAGGQLLARQKETNKIERPAARRNSGGMFSAPPDNWQPEENDLLTVVASALSRFFG